MADEVACGWIMRTAISCQKQRSIVCKHFLASILALQASKLRSLRLKMGVSWPMPFLIILSIILSLGGRNRTLLIGGMLPFLQSPLAWQKVRSMGYSLLMYVVWGFPGRCMAWYCSMLTIRSYVPALFGPISVVMLSAVGSPKEWVQASSLTT